MNREVKQVVVMRADLGMRKGKMIAQAGHAYLGAFLQRIGKNFQKKTLELFGTFNFTDPMYEWLNRSFTKICARCDSEDELLDLVKKGKEAGLNVCLITDAGKTEFNGVPTITCACFGPDWAEEIDKITGHLKLL